jgi:hypothetical protein
MRKAEGVKGLRGEGGVDEKMVNDEWSRAGVGIQKIPHSIIQNSTFRLDVPSAFQASTLAQPSDRLARPAFHASLT